MTRPASKRRTTRADATESVPVAAAVGKRILDRLALEGRTFVHVHPGDVYFAEAPCAISTLLGSCVAVCLWDPETRVGGITHYILPDPLDRGEFSTRFGRVAVSVLVENLVRIGASLPRLRAKIFGGGNVVSSIPTRDSVGERNIALAHSVLEALKIPVLNEDTGGTAGRVLVFFSDNGVALVRKV